MIGHLVLGSLLGCVAEALHPQAAVFGLVDVAAVGALGSFAGGQLGAGLCSRWTLRVPSGVVSIAGGLALVLVYRLLLVHLA